MAILSNFPAACQVRNTKAVSIHVRTLAAPAFSYSKAIAIAKQVYSDIGVAFNVLTELCPVVADEPAIDLTEIDGQCDWDKFNAEQESLYKRASPGATGITVFIVGGIRKTNGSALAGCAGHAPSKPAAIVSADKGTVYTIAHEVGHVLLGPKYTPVHTNDVKNIMINGTHKIPMGTITYFTEGQRQQILKSTFLANI